MFEKQLVVEFVEVDYMVTKSAKGEDCLHYLDNPERLCEVLAEAMKYLHSRSTVDVPVSLCMDVYATAQNGNCLNRVIW